MSDQIRADLQAAGRLMIERGLTWGNAGNISARSGPDMFLITASGARLGELSLDDFVDCPVVPDSSIRTERKPSKELPMHRAIYEVRPEINIVLHAEPLHSTLVACTDLEVPANGFISAMYYLERAARVPYFHPGSAALGEAVRERARSANVLLLENHGVLVYDTSMREATMALETLEIACQMLILARGAGLNVRTLPPATVADFLNNAGYKPRRLWPTS
jgi:L-fuculose-phosphate aldolase